MGSTGLGTVFPNYLTEEELRLSSIARKNEQSLLGHNTINYEKLLQKGMQHIIDFAKSKRKPNLSKESKESQAFYHAVEISCQAVIKFAHRFADLADQEAKRCSDHQRQKELKRMAETCRKVPAQPAQTFYEAVQSIWITHCCLHASMNYMSLGRLDQVLNPYLTKETKPEEAIELLQNFIIKAAGRLNLTTEYVVEQDHMNFHSNQGVHPYFTDQRATLNNFLQSVVIGGKKPNGEDATNPCTFLILEAFKKVNLSTPGLYVRLHKNSPPQLYQAVANSLRKTRNLPSILNDDTIIPAIYKALKTGANNPDQFKTYEKMANDYCVDGCWEPILNGISDWTFKVINGLTVLECALNHGSTLSSSRELLRGQKLGPDSGPIDSYIDLQKALQQQIQFFVDQSILSMCMYYTNTELVVPSPLVSALLGTCLETGRDKSWGGCQYNLAGSILGGVPDMVNTIAAIRKWVFDTSKYSLEQVLNALRDNFKVSDMDHFKTQHLYDSIKIDFFTNSPQFGNNSETDEITSFVLNIFHQAVLQSGELAHRVFVDSDGDQNAQIKSLRATAGYYGDSLEKRFPDFELKFTAGLGTFEQYVWQGMSNAASASRIAQAPLAPNFTPVSGTWHTSPALLLETFSKLNLSHFAAGAVTDICLSSDALLDGLLKAFIQHKGSIMTCTIAVSEYQEIYEIAQQARLIKDKQARSEQLMTYADILVRVGGWNAPFITLPLSHMKNYVHRSVSLTDKRFNSVNSKA